MLRLVFGPAAATVLTPRLYTAATQLQVARQSPIQLRLDRQRPRVDDSDRNVNGTSSFLATQVAMLESRDLAERVIRRSVSPRTRRSCIRARAGRGSRSAGSC